MTTVVVAMTGITVSRLASIPADIPVSAPAPTVRVRVGVPRAQAAPIVAPLSVPAPIAVTPAPAASTPDVAEPSPSSGATDAAPDSSIAAESPTLPLSPATLMVGLAAARSRALASASPRPAPAAECGRPVADNLDPNGDIAGMTGMPGRKMYYGRSTQQSASAAACGRGAQAARSTP
ncbi:MAG TPA: hypothetical protein VMR23_13870 [Candidatus Limnocylindria bacterium]|nr:hypothetical protein [Candidatus Limnocylindria bacterium]